MKLKVDGSGVLNRIRRAMEVIVDRDGKMAAERLLEAIVENTPVKTGYARSRWTLQPADAYALKYTVGYSAGPFFKEARWVLSNDAPYIIYLNQGSSKQAPPFFIEMTIQSQGFKLNSTISGPGVPRPKDWTKS